MTSSDKETIQENIDKIDELLESGNLTEDEKTALEEVKQTAEDLLDKIAEVEKEIKDVTAAIDGYDKVTVDDRTAIQETLASIEALLNSKNLTEEERRNVNEVKEKGELLLKEIDEIKVGVVEENVETGDINHYMIYMILMILSGGCILTLRKKEE